MLKLSRIIDFIKEVYYRSIYRLIPQYHGRTIFTAFYWRTLRDRRRKGYDETELWSLDYSLTRLIAPRLRDFAESFKTYEFGFPGFLLEEEYQAAVKKGFAWNSRWHRLENKKENKKCWKRAARRWYSILDEMARGFEDMKLEQDDWEAWVKKWDEVAKKYQRKIDKAKTFKQKQTIWNQIGSFREYKPSMIVNAEDVTYTLHQRARDLLAQYYGHLWW